MRKKTMRNAFPLWIKLYCVIAIIICFIAFILQLKAHTGRILGDTTTSTQQTNSGTTSTTNSPTPSPVTTQREPTPVPTPTYPPTTQTITDKELICKNTSGCSWISTTLTCTCETISTTNPTPTPQTTNTTLKTTTPKPSPTLLPNLTPRPSPSGSAPSIFPIKELRDATEIERSSASATPPASIQPSPIPRTVFNTIEETCLKNILGENYEAFKNANYQPNTTQISQIKNCVGQSTANAEKTVNEEPPRPVEVLIAKKNNDIKVSTIKKEVQENKAVMRVEGTGPANTTLYLYIQSDPIVVTVQTDANGKWSYVLNESLEAGDHKVYVASKPTSGELVRSEIVPFQLVRTAQAAGNTDTFDIVTKPNENLYNNYFIYAAIISLVASIGTTIILALTVFKNYLPQKAKS